MYRLSARRAFAHRAATTAAVATLAAPLLLITGAATPALAHGAPTDPVSRMSACSPEGGSLAGSAACRAAIAANGAPFTEWDNLRIAGVNGRDRQVVPDGQLCSGGLAAYKGLDLARADWPSTRLSPGAALDLTYRSTIPHTGTFKLFLTKPGYDPTEPLKWSDLPEKPFATITDPPLENVMNSSLRAVFGVFVVEVGSVGGPSWTPGAVVSSTQGSELCECSGCGFRTRIGCRTPSSTTADCPSRRRMCTWAT